MTELGKGTIIDGAIRILHGERIGTMSGILLYFAYLAAIGFCGFCVGWLLLCGDKNQTTRALAACQVLIIIWCLPQLFLAFPLSLAMKFGLYAVSYLGISFIGPCWLLFSCFYCRRQPKAWMRILLFGLSAVDYLMFLTNDLHHLFYLSFGLEGVTYGPVFYFHMACTYLWVILGMAVILYDGRKKNLPGHHGAMIILAAAVPLCVNALYLSGTVKAGFDLTPPVFALSSFLLLLAVFRYDLLDINVVAFRHIFDAVAEGVIVYNRQENITYCNRAARRLFSVKNGDSLDELRKKLSQYGADLTEEIPSFSSPKGLLLTLPEGEKVQLKQYLLRQKEGERPAGIFLFTDVGEYYELLRQSRELAVSRQHLAIEQERNRIAQEVHDTTGHTLTMIQSLVKLARIQYEKDQASPDPRTQDETKAYLLKAQELAGDGIRELRWAINHMRQGSSLQLVSQGVYQLTDRVKELDIQVEIQGEDGPEYSHLSGIVYKCLREAITNCLNYAKASRMDVIVKFAGDSVSVYIFDDGCGCDSIKESHGLSGIRKRVEEAYGQVRFFSAPGEGFQMVFTLPLKGEGDTEQGEAG